MTRSCLKKYNRSSNADSRINSNKHLLWHILMLLKIYDVFTLEKYDIDVMNIFVS